MKKSKIKFYLDIIIPDFILKNYFVNNFFRLFLGYYKRKIKRLVFQEDNSSFLKRLEKKIPVNVSLNNISKKENNDIINQADEILIGNYSFLGVSKLDFENINWHIDYNSSFEWPPFKYYKKYIQVDLDNNADVKVPRELSRSHHILKVALAFNLTKDKKYSDFVIDQMTDWINENPLMYSINWGCSMDVAIRAVNWIWSLALITKSNINSLKLNNIRVSLYEHGWFIYRNLEGNCLSYNNNHYLSNLSGLIFIGSIFNDDNESKKWINYAKYCFYREIRIQILPSGMSYERSFHYHRLVLELILWPTVLLKNNKETIPQDIWTNLENMFGFLLKTCKPNGSIPNIGDQDNGRFLPFGTENINDFKYLFSIGSHLFERSDMIEFNNGYNIYCSQLLLNRANINNIEIQKQTNHRGYLLSDAGFYAFKNKKNYLIFNIQSTGGYIDSFNSSIHTHADLFSFELFINNNDFIIDSGTYAYTSSKKNRNIFRGTRMHNTVFVDNTNQEDLNENVLFEMTNNSKVSVNSFYENEKSIFISATHSSYEKLKNPVYHERSIEYFQDQDEWEIKDNLIGEGAHKFEILFNFAENIGLDIVNENSVKAYANDFNAIISFESISDFKIIKENSIISKSYGELTKSKLIVIESNSSCPFMLKTKIKSRNEK